MNKLNKHIAHSLGNNAQASKYTCMTTLIEEIRGAFTDKWNLACWHLPITDSDR